MAALLLFSPAFGHQQQIPRKYTCDGDDVSPWLRMEQVPPETRSLALIVDDPDAPRGTWVHWVLWNIDPVVRDIKEGTMPAGAIAGMNDFRKSGYGGPCPPSGTHRYCFKLYALDTVIALGTGSSKEDLETAMKGHILGQAEMIGLHSRT
jgi:Raf kinase inhibitor-like YbhB/YbcL family protein